MGQPGMRVTVDAAMRARDVSRLEVDPAPEDIAAAGTRAASGPDAGADSVPHGTGDHPDAASRPQRDRRGKAERRRLSKRHARARR